jgi:chromosome segregation ATPase
MLQVKNRFVRLPVAVAVILGSLSFSLSAHADEKGAIDAVNSRVTAVAAQANDAKESAAVANNTAQSAMAAAQQANQRIDQLTRMVDDLQQQLSAAKSKGRSKSPRN